MEAGTAKSERDATRKIAEDTGEAEATVRSRVRRGKKELDASASKTKETDSDFQEKLAQIPEKDRDLLPVSPTPDNINYCLDWYEKYTTNLEAEEETEEEGEEWVEDDDDIDLIPYSEENVKLFRTKLRKYTKTLEEIENDLLTFAEINGMIHVQWELRKEINDFLLPLDRMMWNKTPGASKIRWHRTQGTAGKGETSDVVGISDAELKKAYKRYKRVLMDTMKNGDLSEMDRKSNITHMLRVFDGCEDGIDDRWERSLKDFNDKYLKAWEAFKKELRRVGEFGRPDENGIVKKGHTGAEDGLAKIINIMDIV